METKSNIKNMLLTNVDSETWNKFVGLSKLKGMRLAEFLEYMVNKELGIK